MKTKWFFSVAILYLFFVSSELNAFTCPTKEELNEHAKIQGRKVNFPGPVGGTWVTIQVASSVNVKDFQGAQVYTEKAMTSLRLLCYYSSPDSGVPLYQLGLEFDPSKTVVIKGKWGAGYCSSPRNVQGCSFELDFSEKH